MSHRSFCAYFGVLLAIISCPLLTFELFSIGLPTEAIAQILLAQSNRNTFGLGLPKTANTGGGTRLAEPPSITAPIREESNPSDTIRPRQPVYKRAPAPRRPAFYLRTLPLPLITLLVPVDGAKTSIAQPTVYWYLNRQELNDNNQADKSPQKLTGRLQIMSGENDQTTMILDTSLYLSQGLSSYKLPIAAALQPSKTYRWQISLQDPKSETVKVSGWIVYTPSDTKLKLALAQALTAKDRAKIYAEAGYWFEAIDQYNKWLSFKPDDVNVSQARNEILQTGLAGNIELDIDALIRKLSSNESPNL